MNITMLVANPCINDTRVIKEAEILVKAGHNVSVLCRHIDSLPDNELKNGVNYYRLNMDSVKSLTKFLFGEDNSTGIFGKKIYNAISGTRNEFKNFNDKTKFKNYVIYKKFLIYTAILLILIFKAISYLIYGRLNFSDFQKTAVKLKPDVIHVHDLSPLSVACRIAKITGAKIIYDSHELERHRNGHGIIRRYISAVKESRYIHKAAHVITVSDSIADYLKDLYGIRRPLVIINVPDVIKHQTINKDIRSVTGIPDNIHLTVYVGKVTFGRGIEEVIKALQFYPEVHFVTLGPKVISTVNRMYAIAESLAVTDRIHILDPVAPDEVVPFLRTADTGIVPIQDVCLSYRFCMPNKLFELASAGIPVCVSDLPEMKKFVEREHIGMTMDQTDPGDIARVLKDVYGRREEFILKGESLGDFEGRYSWSKQAEKLIQLYQEMADSQAAHIAEIKTA